jgi:hypothetical protein
MLVLDELAQKLAEALERAEVLRQEVEELREEKVILLSQLNFAIGQANLLSTIDSREPVRDDGFGEDTIVDRGPRFAQLI